MAFFARDTTFEMVPDGLWSFDGTSVFGLPSKYNKSGRRHAAPFTVTLPITIVIIPLHCSVSKKL
jgi:hypothetical protein